MLNVTQSVKSRLKSENHYEITSINQTIHVIPIFDMMLLRQYYRYQGCVFTEYLLNTVE